MQSQYNVGETFEILQRSHWWFVLPVDVDWQNYCHFLTHNSGSQLFSTLTPVDELLINLYQPASKIDQSFHLPRKSPTLDALSQTSCALSKPILEGHRFKLWKIGSCFRVKSGTLKSYFKLWIYCCTLKVFSYAVFMHKHMNIKGTWQTLAQTDV